MYRFGASHVTTRYIFTNVSTQAERGGRKPAVRRVRHILKLLERIRPASCVVTSSPLLLPRLRPNSGDFTSISEAVAERGAAMIPSTMRVFVCAILVNMRRCHLSLAVGAPGAVDDSCGWRRTRRRRRSRQLNPQRQRTKARRLRYRRRRRCCRRTRISSV